MSSASTSSQLLALANVRVLVVEDDADSREVMGILVRRHGGTTTLASNVRAALHAIEVFSPDVVVSDVRMGGVEDGNALVRALRASPQARIPAIAVSGNAREIDKLRSLDAGFDAYLVKPVLVDQLVAAILAALASRRAPHA